MHAQPDAPTVKPKGNARRASREGRDFGWELQVATHRARRTTSAQVAAPGAHAIMDVKFMTHTKICMGPVLRMPRIKTFLFGLAFGKEV